MRKKTSFRKRSNICRNLLQNKIKIYDPRVFIFNRLLRVIKFFIKKSKG